MFLWKFLVGLLLKRARFLGSGKTLLFHVKCGRSLNGSDVILFAWQFTEKKYVHLRASCQSYFGLGFLSTLATRVFRIRMQKTKKEFQSHDFIDAVLTLNNKTITLPVCISKLWCTNKATELTFVFLLFWPKKTSIRTSAACFVLVSNVPYPCSASPFCKVLQTK